MVKFTGNSRIVGYLKEFDVTHLVRTVWRLLVVSEKVWASDIRGSNRR